MVWVWRRWWVVGDACSRQFNVQPKQHWLLGTWRAKHPLMFLALFTVRARLIWVLLAGVPIAANGALLMLPAVVDEAALEFFRQGPESF